MTSQSRFGFLGALLKTDVKNTAWSLNLVIHMRELNTIRSKCFVMQRTTRGQSRSLGKGLHLPAPCSCGRLHVRPGDFLSPAPGPLGHWKPSSESSSRRPERQALPGASETLRPARFPCGAPSPHPHLSISLCCVSFSFVYASSSALVYLSTHHGLGDLDDDRGGRGCSRPRSSFASKDEVPATSASLSKSIPSHRAHPYDGFLHLGVEDLRSARKGSGEASRDVYEARVSQRYSDLDLQGCSGSIGEEERHLFR